MMTRPLTEWRRSESERVGGVREAGVMKATWGGVSRAKHTDNTPGCPEQVFAQYATNAVRNQVTKIGPWYRIEASGRMEPGDYRRGPGSGRQGAAAVACAAQPAPYPRQCYITFPPEGACKELCSLHAPSGGLRKEL